MTLFLIFIAAAGWLAAFILLGILMILSLAFGASQELVKEELKDTLKRTPKHKTHLWSSAKEKEIPFGD